MVKKLAVVGSGLMGTGIAQVALEGGMEVAVYDIAEASIEKSMATIRTFLQKKVDKGKLGPEQLEDMLRNLKGTANLEEALKDACFVIEAATERMDVKKNIFRELDRVAGPGAFLASNTSTLSITEIAAVTGRPEKVLGTHFFSPVPLMRLVEIVRGEKTAEETISAALELARALGKTAIVVKDVPGFIVNRFMCLLYNEGAFQVQNGIARPEDIDAAMKLGANHPMGPLELMDLVGIDVCYYALKGIYEATGDERFKPCPLFEQMLAKGKLGRKSGEGFYKYN